MYSLYMNNVCLLFFISKRIDYSLIPLMQQHKRGTDQPLGRIEMFKITHIKKDGTIFNDDAIEKIVVIFFK